VKLVVGLGNPGPRYAASRHNVGFRIVDRLASEQARAIDEPRFLGRFAQGFVPSLAAAGGPSEPLGFLKPETFMNRSGDAVAAAVRGLSEIEPSRDLLVVYDDLDLPLGRIRLRPRGGPGGHNGMTSVIEALGTRDFARLRFGIGRPDGPTSVVDYVLEPFSPVEERILADRVPAAAAAAATLLAAGPALAMDRFNREASEGG
jgi:PTH1 family peptidyl-tRNA hydrolase